MVWYVSRYCGTRGSEWLWLDKGSIYCLNTGEAFSSQHFTLKAMVSSVRKMQPAPWRFSNQEAVLWEGSISFSSGGTTEELIRGGKSPFGGKSAFAVVGTEGLTVL